MELGLLPVIPGLVKKYGEDELKDVDLVLASESFFHDFSGSVNSSTNVQLNIENLKSIQDDPYLCYQNVVFNSPQELETEVQSILKQLNVTLPPETVQPQTGKIQNEIEEKSKVNDESLKADKSQPVIPIKVLIVDTTRNSEGKSNENLQELEKLTRCVKFVRSLLPFIEFEPEVKEADRRKYEESLTLDRLKTNFFTDSSNPGVIGRISFNNLSKLPKSNEALTFGASLKFSAKYFCPIILDSDGCSYVETIKPFISKMHEKDFEAAKSSILLLGLKVKVKVEYSSQTGSGFIRSTAFDFSDIFAALQFGQYVEISIFDMLEQRLTVRDIVEMIQQLCKNTTAKGRLVVGAGIKFKTQLAKFSGAGLKVVIQIMKMLEESGVDKQTINLLFRDNALRLLTWWRPLKYEVKVVPDWQCSECKKMFPESHPKISKLDFIFCSPPCFKAGLKKIPK